MRPLVFSLVPRSHEWYACAEKHRMSVAVSIPFQLLFSGPRSSVMVCLAFIGTSLNRVEIASTVSALVFPASLVMNTSPVLRSTSVLIPGLWSHDSTVSPSQSPIRERRSTIAGRSSIHRPSGFATRWNRRAPCGIRRLRRLRRYTRRSSPPRTTEPLRICAYMNWYTASCETLSLRSIRILPAICSGDQRFLRCLTTYDRIRSFLRRSVLPRLLRCFRARSWARRGVYLSFTGDLFLRISRIRDECDRPSFFAMERIDSFRHSPRSTSSRSSTVKCWYFIPRYISGVVHLLVELTYPPLLFLRFLQYFRCFCEIPGGVYLYPIGRKNG